MFVFLFVCLFYVENQTQVFTLFNHINGKILILARVQVAKPVRSSQPCAS